MNNELSQARWQRHSAPNQQDPMELARISYANSISAGANFGGKHPASVSKYMTDKGANPMDMGEYYGAAEQLAEPETGFWKGLLDKGMTVFETLAIPQQIGYQLITGGDWRKALPDYMSPDDWQREGVHHEMITASDVLNVWSDNAFDDWYKSDNILAMSSEFLFKTALFGVDVFTDPLTYVSGSSAVKVLRKALPVGVQAEFATKMAVRTAKEPHAAEALEVADRFLREATERHAVEGTEESARILAAAKSNRVVAEENDAIIKTTREFITEDEVIINKPPMREGDTAVPLGNGWDDADRAAHAESFAKDKTNIRNTVLGTDDPVTLHNMSAMGQDDAAIVSEALGIAAIGGDPMETLIRVPKVRDYYLATNLTPQGVVSPFGTALEAADKTTALKVLRTELREKVAALKDLPEPPAGVARKELTDAENYRFGPWYRAKRDIARREKYIDKVTKSEKLSDKIISDAAVLPSSARRAPIQASDYIDSKWGYLASRVAGVALYPKSIMPKPAGWFSHLMREPTRVLADASPEMRQRMTDGLKEYNYFLNYTRGTSLDIMQKAGIYETKGLKHGIKSKFVHNAEGTVNKEKAAELTELLNAKYPGSSPSKEAIAKARGEFDALYSAASPEMRQAHDDMRALLDAMAVKLKIPPDMYIDGYVPHLDVHADHFLDGKWFENGRLNPDMEGLPAKTRVSFGNLLARTGTEFEQKDIAAIMDVYTRGAARKAFIEPMTKDLEYMARKLSVQEPKNGWLVNFTDDLIKNINGEPSSVSRIMTKIVGDDKAAILKTGAGHIASLGYAAALTGNMRYPIMSLLQSLNTTSAQYGPLRTLKGLASMMGKEGREQALKAGLDNEVTQIYSGVSSLSARLKLFHVPSIAETEFNIRGLTYHASLGDELSRRGYKHIDDVADVAERQQIFAHAVRATEETNHVFGAIGRPVGHHRVSRTGAMLATQFMSFPFKQTETLLSIAGENPGAFLDYLYSAGKIQYLAAKGLDIDVSEYVGVSYAKDIPKIFSGERETIPLAAIDNMHRFLSTIPQMMDGASAFEKQEAWDAFYKSVEMMIPGKTGVGQVAHGLEYFSGKTGQIDVRKDRRSGLEALVGVAQGKGSFNELKFGELQYTKTQSDFASIVTGMNSLKGKQERLVGLANFERSKNVKALQQSLTDDIWDMVRTGKDYPDKLRKKIGELRALGVDYKDLSGVKDRMTRITYAANMSVKQREQELGNPALRGYLGHQRKSIEGR